MPPRLNIPPITRILLIALLSQSLLGFAIRYRQWSEESDIVVPYLALVPQLSLIYPWTFVTTTLVENNLLTLGISGLTIFYGGRYLERAWTSVEFAKFLLVSSFVPNAVAFGVLVILFAMTGDMRWSLTSVNGTIPLQIAFLVAFSQLVPAHTVTLFRGILSLRVPRFPLLHVLTIFLLSLTPLLSAASVLLATSSFLVSWTYLRFYKHAFPDLDASQSSSLRGDASETFAFAEFFPDPMKPLVAGVSDAIFGILIAIRVCKPFSAADVSASRGETFIQRGTPGGARAEAERRRALALKALDQRLHAATAGSSKPQAPPAASSGPSVQVQPQPSSSPILGETSYAPDKEDEKGGH
jgi:membrane associated rhomboid family serine protease